jgi:acetoin utilization protein AcuB
MFGPKIVKYMTVCPHTIGTDQPLDKAHRMMREHKIRHLPVLRGGDLVGILSQRDLYFLESIAGVLPGKVSVEEAMTAEPFSVDPDASVERVVGEMAKHKYGCAVVMEHRDVLGLFTTTDALKVLHDLLAERHPRREPARRRAHRS